MRRAARKGLMVICVVVALLGAAAPHALAQDFQHGSTVTLRLTDQGPVASAAFFTGALTILANKSVSGALGADGFLGLLLPDGHTIVGVTSTNASAGLTALFASGTLAPSQADLAGTWRVAHYSGQQGPGGLTETAFGTLVVDPLGVVAGALQYSDGVTRTIVDGHANISGSWTIRVADGESVRTIDAVGVMSRDTGFIAAVTSEQTDSRNASGMIFLDRTPPPGTTYARSDLAGTWQVFSLQGAVDDSADGTWLRGTLMFDAAGTLVDARLVDADGVAFPAMSAGAFEVDGQGLVAGAAAFTPGGELDVTAAMLAGKTQIIGVSRIDPGDGMSPSTLGLFTLIKQPVEAPPASQVKFGAASYKTTEGLPVTITVNRTGAKSTAVTVDYAVRTDAGDLLASGTLTFAVDQGSRTFTFTPAQNSLAEGDRTVQLTLSNPTNGAALANPSTASLAVADDESLIEFTADHYTEKENASSATITLRRTGGLGSPSTVQVSATAGTAVPGKDFTPVSQQVTFSGNVTTKTFKVPLIDNKLLDGNRTVMLTVSLAPPSGGPPPVIGPRSTATLTILDNDQPGVLKLSASSYSAKEGSTVTITVKRQASGSSPLGGNVSVDYIVSSNGSAVAGLDYTVATGLTGTLTFVGTETSLKVPIQLVEDTLAEGQEYFLFSLANPTNGATLGAPSTATVSINDNDDGGKVMLSASTFSVSEGVGNLSVTIKRTGGKASNVSVLFTTGGGTAVPGTDYTSVSTAVEFGFNETTRTVVIPILQDSVGDGDRTFNVTLGNVQGGATLGSPSSAVVTIRDDDAAVQFTQPLFTATEGTPGTITLIRTGPLMTQATVSVNISAISAVPGVDFTGPLSRTLTFASNVSRQSFQITTVNNTLPDGNRSVRLSMAVLSGGVMPGLQDTAIFTIVDDEQPGVVRLGRTAYSGKEGTVVMVDIVRGAAAGRSGPLSSSVTVDYATVAGNASAGSDFTPVSGTAVFGPGQTKASVPVTILQNQVVDPARVFHFTLSNPAGGAALGPPSSAPITILDDDVAGTVFFGASAYTVREDVAGGNVSIVVRRTGGMAANVSVDFSTMTGTALADDYFPVATRLTFAAGESSKTVAVPIVDDPRAQGDEFFTVVLSHPSPGLKLGSPSSATVTILDDDPFTVIEFSGRFRNNQPEVVRKGITSSNVSVDYVATSGTAQLGVDFILPPGTLVFAPGVTSLLIPIKTLRDGIAEGPETFTITLVDPSPPATLGPNFAQEFSIIDKDSGGTVSFAGSSPTATLGQVVPITLRRSGGSGTVMTVRWAATGGTALAGTDFSPASGSVTFLGNESTQTFFVTIGEDPTTPGKTIVFDVTVPVPNAALGTPGTATLTILGPTTLTFGDDFYDVTELGGSRTVTILRAGNLGAPATVQYATSDGTATAGADYTAVSGTATFLPGQTTVTFAVPIVPHVMLEPTQTIGLALGNASSGAVLGAPSTAVIEITDVPPAMIQFSSAGFNALDTAGVATITVTRTGNLALDSRVDFRTRDGLARASAGDYVPVSGALTFPPSTGPAQMLTFTVNLAGKTGTVNLALANVSSHTVLGTRDAVLSIDAAPPATAAGVTILYAGRGFDVTVPAINDTGQFAYSLSQAGVTTIFSGDLASPSDQRTAAVVPDGVTKFFTGDTTPVDSSERVVFETKLPAGNTEGLALASNTSGSSVILQTSETVSAVFEPVMSTNGTIAVAARVLDEGTGNFETSVLRGDATGNFVVVASRGTPTAAGALTSIVSTVAVNNAGTVAFYSNTQGKSGIFTAAGTTVTTVASTAGNFGGFRGRVSINDAGAVAFIGTPRGGKRTVYVADSGGSLTQVAVEGQPGGFTDLVSRSGPLIGNGGAVAFTAFFKGGHGIFTGPDLVMDKVITTGDTLGGRVVTQLTLGGINNAGQISFRAKLDDGSFAAAVFTPAP